MKNTVVTDIMNDLKDGLCTMVEAKQDFAAVGIHGDFRADRSFIGYDYNNQEWIDTKLSVQGAPSHETYQ